MSDSEPISPLVLVDAAPTAPADGLGRALIAAAIATDDGLVDLYRRTLSINRQAQLYRYLCGLVIWKREAELKTAGRSLESWVVELEDKGLLSRATVFRYKSEAKSITLRLFSQGLFFNDLQIDGPEADVPDAAWFKHDFLPALDLSIFDEPAEVERLAAVQMELALKGGSQRARLFKVNRQHLQQWLSKFYPRLQGTAWQALPKRIRDIYERDGHKWDPRSATEIRDAQRADLRQLARDHLEAFERHFLDARDLAVLEAADWAEIDAMVRGIYRRVHLAATGQEAEA